MNPGSGGANIGSLEALDELRAAINLFAAEAAAALAEADADLQRTVQWLRLDRLAYWQKQIRLRQEELTAAKTNLYRRELAAAPDTPSAIEERRALDRAKNRLLEAEERLAAVKKWIVVWDREGPLYKGQCQPLADAIARDLPLGAARLAAMRQNLDRYVQLSAPTAEPADSASFQQAVDAAMARMGGPGEAPPHGDGETPDAPTGAALLRRRTPRGSSRDSVALTDPLAIVWAEAATLLDVDEAQALERMALSAEPPDATQRVLLEEGALAEPLLYLERVSGCTPGDSGWFIGSGIRAAAAGLQVVPISTLVERRPDLAPVLALPHGSLLLLAAGRVQSLLDSQDAELWHGPAELEESTPNP